MDLPNAAPRRVSIVGSTGTGKTTFGRELAAILAVPFVELDGLFWGPNWSKAAPDAFQARVREAMGGGTWVIDGNYGGAGVREIVWSEADTIVWLDFPLAVIFPRLWRRTIARLRDRAELWPGTGNRESVRGAFFSRESLFWWALKTYRQRRRNYTGHLAHPRYASVTRLRFTDPREADRWLEERRAAARGAPTR